MLLFALLNGDVACMSFASLVISAALFEERCSIMWLIVNVARAIQTARSVAIVTFTAELQRSAGISQVDETS